MGLGAGQIVYEDDLQNRFPQVYGKSGATARLSTTTLSDDPDLSGITLSVGTWSIELLLFYTVASTTPKIKTRWIFTGTWGAHIRLCHGPGNNTGFAPNVVDTVTLQGYVLDTQDAIYNSSTSSAYSAVYEACYNVDVTVEGQLSLQWAQSVSTASNVTVQSASAFRLQKLPD